MRHIYFMLLLLTICTVNQVKAQSISPELMGINAWMPDSIGDGTCSSPNPPSCRFYGRLHELWARKIAPLNTSIIRFGGIAADVDQPTYHQYVEMIDSIRALGAEPLLQVPVNDGTYSAANAANIVNEINNVRGKNITYWSIGNEPVLNYGSWNTAADIRNYIINFSVAMKNVDSTIKIVGPDLAWYNYPIMADLIGGSQDITGPNGSGQFYVDIISVHIYPFGGGQSKAGVINHPTGTFATEINDLTIRLNVANSTHGRTGGDALTWAIGELNVNYQNPGSNTVWGVGAHSFIAGQWMAEIYSIGMANGAQFMLPWSVHESAGSRGAGDLGLLDNNTTYVERSTYYHLQMIAQHFRGSYASGTDNQGNVKAFGSYDGSQVAVMVLNQDGSNDYAYTLRLNTGAVTGSDPLKINIDAGIAAEYRDTIPRDGTHLLVFDASGSLTKICEYTLTNHAAINIAPTCETTLPVTLINFYVEEQDKQQTFFWQTAYEKNNDYFVLQYSHDMKKWETLGVVEGTNNKHGHQYSFNTALATTSITYFKLIQVDMDGSSKTVGLVSLKNKDALPLIFPNPAHSGQKITINNIEGVNDIMITTPQGSILFNLNIKQINKNTICLDHIYLLSGIYLMSLSYKDHILTKKLIIH